MPNGKRHKSCCSRFLYSCFSFSKGPEEQRFVTTAWNQHFPTEMRTWTIHCPTVVLWLVSAQTQRLFRLPGQKVFAGISAGSWVRGQKNATFVKIHEIWCRRGDRILTEQWRHSSQEITSGNQIIPLSSSSLLTITAYYTALVSAALWLVGHSRQTGAVRRPSSPVWKRLDAAQAFPALLCWPGLTTQIMSI